MELSTVAATEPDVMTVVYQMGKVGSSSLYESLRLAGIPRLFKVHYLSHQGLAQARRLYAGFSVSVPVPHLQATLALQRLLSTRPATLRWRVFTLVRDLIARDISAYVQMVDLLNPRLVAGAVPDVARIARAATAQFIGFNETRNYTCQWFDTELRSVFHVDVYAYPFHHAQGWLRIRSDTVDIAIIRLEDLDRVFEEATLALIGHRVPLVYASARSADKLQAAYEASVYRQIIPLIRMSESACRAVYRSRYVRHFYTNDEIEAFLQKWTNPDKSHPQGR